MAQQKYEDYWKLTLAHSDFTGDKFTGYLRYIVDFIDANRFAISTNLQDAYEKLQAGLIVIYPIDDVSTRKAINQFIKLGFVESGLAGYHVETKNFLNEPDASKKMTLFSKIVYSNASFNRSVSATSSINEIGFFIKTLTHHGGSLTKEQAQAMMTLEIANIPTGYANEAELASAVVSTRFIDFSARKYNQMAYFWNVLGKLDDLVVDGQTVYLSSDPRVESILTERDIPKKVRDSYLQRLYKNQLIEESKTIYGGVVCMAEKLDYPVLIASHIKPYAHSSEPEAFDANNGLLLSRNIDQLFDQGYISFDDDGTMLVSKTRNLSEDLSSHLQTYTLDRPLLSSERCSYLAYHRNNIFVA